MSLPAGSNRPNVSSPRLKATGEIAIDSAQREDLIDMVRSNVRGISREDAEDALQDALIVLTQKAATLEPGPIGGYLLRTARFKALHIRDGHQGTLSLDALVDAAGDGAHALIDQRGTDLDAHLQLGELANDPISRRALDAAKHGASGQIAPRGMRHQAARYSDEQVATVRSLRAEGLTYPEIEARTGVTANYCAALVRRVSRLLPTSEGWTRTLVIDAIRRFHTRHGRVPRVQDTKRDRAMPAGGTAHRLFGSWQDAVRAAGLEPAYGGRRVRAWTDDELVQALCAWRLKRARWPTCADLAQDPELPSPATARRRLGTQSPERLRDVVLLRLA